MEAPEALEAEGLEVAVAKPEAGEGVEATAMARAAEEWALAMAMAAAEDSAVASGVSLGAGSVAEVAVGNESRLLLAG